jgi:hypothetical protein
MKTYITIIIAFLAIFAAGCEKETVEVTVSEEVSVNGDFDIEAFLDTVPAPQSYDEYWDWDVTAYPNSPADLPLRWRVEDAYRDRYRERILKMQAEQDLQEAAQMLALVSEGFTFTSHIEVDPVAYAQLMTRASVPGGTDMAIQMRLDSYNDKVLVTYGGAITVSYSVTGLIREFGAFVGQMPGGPDEAEVEETVEEWHKLLHNVTDLLAAFE